MSVIHRKIHQDKVTFYKKGSLNNNIGRAKNSAVISVRGRRDTPAKTPANTPEENDATVEHMIRQILLPSANGSIRLFDTLPQPTNHPSINLQWYALISLIIREFVKSWYDKISSDSEFINDVINILVHVTRQVESRLCQVDFETLLLDTLPAVLNAHVADYRLARARVGTAMMPNMTLDEVYHSIRPHPALNRDGESVYLNVMGNGILALVLDPDDLNSEILRSLVLRILVDLGLVNLIDKLSEPWMVFELLAKIEGSSATETTEATEATETAETTGTAETTTTTTATTINQLSYLLTKTISTTKRHIKLLSRGIGYITSVATTSPQNPATDTNPPLVSRYIFPFLRETFQISSRRPLLHATLQFLAVPLTIDRIAQIINRIVSDNLYRYVIVPQTVARGLKLARTILFPNNGPMMPARPTPDETQVRELRNNAKLKLRNLLNQFNRVGFENTENDVESILTMLGSKSINQHLLMTLLDVLVSEIFPELIQHTPSSIIQSKTKKLN